MLLIDLVYTAEFRAESNCNTRGTFDYIVDGDTFVFSGANHRKRSRADERFDVQNHLFSFLFAGYKIVLIF